MNNASPQHRSLCYARQKAETQSRCILGSILQTVYELIIEIFVKKIFSLRFSLKCFNQFRVRSLFLMTYNMCQQDLDYELIKCFEIDPSKQSATLRWRQNGRDGVSNHQSHDCLLNRLFRRRSKKTSKLRVTGLCAGNSPGTGEFPAQMASNAENFWWRHYEFLDAPTHKIDILVGKAYNFTENSYKCDSS